MTHIKVYPPECKHKLTIEGERLVCAYCGETFKM